MKGSYEGRTKGIIQTTHINLNEALSWKHEVTRQGKGLEDTRKRRDEKVGIGTQVISFNAFQ